MWGSRILPRCTPGSSKLGGRAACSRDLVISLLGLRVLLLAT